MKVDIQLDETCTETIVHITASSMSEEVTALLKRISNEAPNVITGFRDDAAQILEQDAIIRLYTEGGKVYANTERGVFLLRLRLYEVESRLDKKRFVRISNAEIVNLSKVKGFDLSFAGTICVNLVNGTQAFVSRRYVSKIKQTLGL